MHKFEKHIINIIVIYLNIVQEVSPETENTKYILIWSRKSEDPIPLFGEGQGVFIENKCPFNDCYVTMDHNYFNGPLIRFDAILFSGIEVLSELTPEDFPVIRETEQKYIYVNQEASVNQPVCLRFFDNFFNWTMTYKLDSDIPYTYIAVLNKKREIVGPRKHMQWIKPDDFVPYGEMWKLQKKTKAVAWFLSDCTSRSRREGYANELDKALKHYNLSIDIYGLCGKLNCTYMPKSYLPAWGRTYNIGPQCGVMLKDNYYFYLAFENAFSEDYVTEKVLWGLQFWTVPIVYGGADYKRFLPPRSYVDATKMKPQQLAFLINENMKSIEKYLKYFAWKRHYAFINPMKSVNMCRLCAALHNRNKMETTSTVQNFRKWWNPKYKSLCKDLLPGLQKKIRMIVMKDGELW